MFWDFGSLYQEASRRPSASCCGSGNPCEGDAAASQKPSVAAAAQFRNVGKVVVSSVALLVLASFSEVLASLSAACLPLPMRDCPTTDLFRQISIRLHSTHTGSILPTTLCGKSPCSVAASVTRRLQNSSSWTDSETESRGAVCLACSQSRCGESPRVKFQRMSSEDCRTPVPGQTVKQCSEMRSALEFFATAQSTLLPTTLWGKSPCEVPETVIRRL